MNKNDLIIFIEECYEKQVQLLLKTKTKQSLNLSKVARQHLKSKIKKNEQVLLQKMINIIYSCQKLEKEFVIQQFLKFLKIKPDTAEGDQYLFYLLLRQYFKVLTGTNFMVILNSRQDLTKSFKLTFQQGMEILKMSCADELALAKLIKAHSQNQSSKSLNLYTFLSQMLAVPLNFKEIELMKSLLELH